MRRILCMYDNLIPLHKNFMPLNLTNSCNVQNVGRYLTTCFRLVHFEMFRNTGKALTPNLLNKKKNLTKYMNSFLYKFNFY
jgi:hypothetical protein